MQKQMRQDNIDSTYKENDMLKKELKNMEILLEENDDLREDVERLKAFSFDERFKMVGDEN
jgi:cell shape-determining protein MreC